MSYFTKLEKEKQQTLNNAYKVQALNPTANTIHEYNPWGASLKLKHKRSLKLAEPNSKCFPQKHNTFPRQHYSTNRLMNQELQYAQHGLWVIWENINEHKSSGVLVDICREVIYFIDALNETMLPSAGVGRHCINAALTKPTKSTHKTDGCCLWRGIRPICCWCNPVDWSQICMHYVLLFRINSGAASKRTAMCQRAQQSRRAQLKSIRVRGSRLLLCRVFYMCPLAESKQTLSSTRQLWTCVEERQQQSRGTEQILWACGTEGSFTKKREMMSP